jgi:uncharacterized membrane protein
VLTNEQLVEKARAFLAERKRLRWYRLIGGVVLLALCISLVVRIVQKLEKQDSLQLTDGFCAGVGLGFMCTTLGTFGAILLAKSGSGFQGGMRSNELLVAYHDRLRELRALPGDSAPDKTHIADSGSQKP